MSLRVRLGLIITLLFLLSMAGSLGRTLLSAQNDVQEELQSTSILVSQLLGFLLEDSDFILDTSKIPDILTQLVQLEAVRHLDIQIESQSRDYQQFNVGVLETVDAPAWFVALVEPESQQLIHSLPLLNGDVLVILTDPTDEIEEVWLHTKTTLLLRLLAILIFNIVLFYFIQRWLKPAEMISEVLESVEREDFNRKIPKLSLPELNEVGEKINRLTSTLGASKSENERLARKSMIILEQERRYLAQELHDSLGQSLSAIKAIAVSIAQRASSIDALSVSSANKIEQIADNSYDSVRDMMSNLRPPVLDELGLETALLQMIDDWNDSHEDTFCRLRINNEFDNLDDNQQINIYRIIQEALTNIVKHASAENVKITLSGSEVITLSIDDDGVGFDMTRVAMGMGLTGIKERVQTLQGDFNIASRFSQGVNIQIEFPRMIRNRRRAGDDR